MCGRRRCRIEASIRGRIAIGFLVTLLATWLAWPGGGAAADAVVTGVWLTQDDQAQVRISDCGDKLCGTIVALRDPLAPDGQPKTDTRNRDASLHSRPIVGLQILRDFIRLDGKRWGDGTIYNPEDGDTYRCTITLDNPVTLIVRGYVGIPLFGKTQIWHRVTE